MPKLVNIAVSDPAAVQTVTLTNLTPQANPLGPGVINFAGAPDFSPHPHRRARAERVSAGQVRPRRGGRPGYSPFIKIAGSDVVYNAPIVDNEARLIAMARDVVAELNPHQPHVGAGGGRRHWARAGIVRLRPRPAPAGQGA